MRLPVPSSFGSGFRLWCFVLCALALFSTSTGRAATDSPAAPPHVTIDTGPLVGRWRGAMISFEGIPYAAPPVGEWRWRPPQPPARWSTTRDASAPGPVCMQIVRGTPIARYAPNGMAEDCLTVNVTAPPRVAGRALPVLVWVTPGGFNSGAGVEPRYRPDALVSQGFVLVTMNYRLGLFGLFAHPALTRAAAADEPLANFAIMDQLAALRRVQRNIAAFGGDPANITVFGMSAGGVSVNTLMILPEARGLFARAISQSGATDMRGVQRVSQPTKYEPSLEESGVKLGAAYGIAADAPDAAARLRALAPDQILAQDMALRPIGGSRNPVIDGRLVRESPLDAFIAGRQLKVPFLIGATDGEGLRGVAGIRIGQEEQIRATTLAMAAVEVREADALYGQDIALADLVMRTQDELFMGTQRFLGRAHAAQGHPTWIYRFSRTLAAERPRIQHADHGAETWYLFDTLANLADPQIAPVPTMGARVSPEDHLYGHMVRGYWLRFARTGDPNGWGGPVWPQALAEGDTILDFAQDGPVARVGLEAERYRFVDERIRRNLAVAPTR
jgi:para-nitrobenzyl esterase